jgi:hypothetical protein
MFPALGLALKTWCSDTGEITMLRKVPMAQLVIFQTVFINYTSDYTVLRGLRAQCRHRLRLKTILFACVLEFEGFEVIFTKLTAF